MTTSPQRRFVVTGATKGIGRATTDLLLAAGHEVIGLSRTSDGFPGQHISVDLSDIDATADAISQLGSLGRIDGLINNVGLVRPAPLGRIELADLHAVYDVNVRVAVQLTQALLPAMTKQRWGRIVNITTLVTTGAAPNRSSYGAAKAALEYLTRAWAMELASTGITVNAVAPGPTETELFRANNAPGSLGEATYLDAVPMRRFAQPAEIAATIAHLCADSSSFITGQTIRVDGGASISGAPREER